MRLGGVLFPRTQLFYFWFNQEVQGYLRHELNSCWLDNMLKQAFIILQKIIQECREVLLLQGYSMELGQTQCCL